MILPKLRYRLSLSRPCISCFVKATCPEHQYRIASFAERQFLPMLLGLHPTFQFDAEHHQDCPLNEACSHHPNPRQPSSSQQLAHTKPRLPLFDLVRREATPNCATMQELQDHLHPKSFGDPPKLFQRSVRLHQHDRSREAHCPDHSGH